MCSSRGVDTACVGDGFVGKACPRGREGKLSLQRKRRAVRDLVAARRLAREGSAAFVSTNDIVTSEILTSTLCNLGFMDVNFRGRIENCDADLAGNYEDKIVYRPADFASPALIRPRPLARLPAKA